MYNCSSFVSDLKLTCCKSVFENTYLACCDTGEIIHYDISESKCVHYPFILQKSFIPALCYAVSLDISPFLPNTFLAGFNSGEIALFSFSNKLPIVTWQMESEIVKVEWSMHRPAIFFALDKSGLINIYDLIQSINEPVFTSSSWGINVKGFKLGGDTPLIYVVSENVLMMYTLSSELVDENIDESKEVLDLIKSQ